MNMLLGSHEFYKKWSEKERMTFLRQAVLHWAFWAIRLLIINVFKPETANI